MTLEEAARLVIAADDALRSLDPLMSLASDETQAMDALADAIDVLRAALGRGSETGNPASSA